MRSPMLSPMLTILVVGAGAEMTVFCCVVMFGFSSVVSRTGESLLRKGVARQQLFSAVVFLTKTQCDATTPLQGGEEHSRPLRSRRALRRHRAMRHAQGGAENSQLLRTPYWWRKMHYLNPLVKGRFLALCHHP